MNSGRPTDPDAKSTVEEYARWAFDLRIIRQRLSQPGTMFSYSWYRKGKPTGYGFSYLVYPNCLELSYQIRQSSGKWESVSERITLDTTPCIYGGQRYWFRCPSCHRRAVVLYILERPYRCRVCLGLGYQSQREQATDRALDRWQTLLRRLGGSGSTLNHPLERPKWMQRRVYERLSEQTEEARLNFWVSLARRF